MEVPYPLPEPSEEPRLLLVPDLEDEEPDAPADAADADDDGEPEAAAPIKEEASDPTTSDPLRLYVRQIGDGRLLTRDEERDLARRKDEGDEAAKRKLIES